MTPLQITFRNLSSSDAIVARIRSEAAKLGRYWDRIDHCRVTVELPHHHHRRGNRCHVKVELKVPRKTIVIKHTPSARRLAMDDAKGAGPRKYEAVAPQKDAYQDIHHAFRHARRQLEDYARRLRGDIKSHTLVPGRRAEKLALRNL